MISEWQHTLPKNNPTLPNQLKTFMQLPSLTVALSQGQASFDVDLCYLGLLTQKKQKLNVGRQQPYQFVREVFLRLNQTPVIWAISRCHKDDFFWQSILNCGTQSLGTILFERHDEDMKRSPLEFSYNIHADCPNTNPLWARRSTFEYQGAILSLQEVFLPALLDFITSE